MSENQFIHKEAFNLLVGSQIGYGIHRAVYEIPLLPGYVAKVEEGARCFSNAMEWAVWDAVRDTEWARWFAPCLQISACGGILIQARTNRALLKDFPDKVPNFFTDLKYANFGMYQGKFVAHDYGLHLLMEQGMSKCLKRADWWGEKPE